MENEKAFLERSLGKKLRMRIAVYYTHYQSLGHSMRVNRIIEILKKKSAEILLIQAGKPQNFLTYGSEIRNVPFSIAGREVFKGGTAKISKERIRKRLYFIKRELKKFKPDIFITEFFPFGRRIFSMEIVTLIRCLKAINPNLKVYASVGYPVIENERVLKFADYYDKILMHCPKNLDLQYIKKALIKINRDDILHFYDKVFRKLKNKVIFTNYIIKKKKSLAKQKIRKIFGISKNQKIILVSRGGGVIYPRIISTAIKTAEVLGKNFFFIVVYGAASSAKEEKIFKEMTKRKQNIALLKFSNNFFDLLRACDLSVSMAGYNTSIETMWLKKKAVIIPKFDNIKKAGIEQYYRALMLKDKIHAAIIDYRFLNPLVLANAIARKLKEREKMHVDKKWFDSERIISREVLA